MEEAREVAVVEARRVLWVVERVALKLEVVQEVMRMVAGVEMVGVAAVVVEKAATLEVRVSAEVEVVAVVSKVEVARVVLVVRRWW